MEARRTRDVSTITVCDDKESNGDSFVDRYNRCGLLNVIQHIDIYGKYRSNYVEKKKKTCTANAPISLISISAPTKINIDKSSDVSIKDIDAILSRFSITTKVSGLYPGHDILSRKAKKNRVTNKKNDFRFGTVVMR